MEDWAEIRRLHRGERMPIKEIARRLGVARNTVRAALAADTVPRYQRARRGSAVDALEPAVRALLGDTPRMPATVIAERIGWTGSITILKDRIRVIRPEYTGIDPADRLVHQPGAATQCDLWFPAAPVPVGHGQVAVGATALPVLTMTLGYSRFLCAVMLPSRRGGDLLAGMWQLIAGVGAVTKTLIWDRESAIGGRGRVAEPVAAFAGTLGTQVKLTPLRDPESKGMVERSNGYCETSFLPGRTFASPQDFNAQLAAWLPRANARLVRSTGARPVDALAGDVAAMIALPAGAPAVGLSARVRLGRDYYVRIDGNDYSIDPAAIGRYVEVTATPTRVIATCAGTEVAAVASGAQAHGGARVVADHARCWARHQNITDPVHVARAKDLRAGFAVARTARARAAGQAVRYQGDGHPVILRALSDYDALFGITSPEPAPGAVLPGPTGLVAAPAGRQGENEQGGAL